MVKMERSDARTASNRAWQGGRSLVKGNYSTLGTLDCCIAPPDLWTACRTLLTFTFAENPTVSVCPLLIGNARSTRFFLWEKSSGVFCTIGLE